MPWISWNVVPLAVLVIYVEFTLGILWTEDSYCVTKEHSTCPDRDVKFFLYSNSKNGYWTKRQLDTSFRYPLTKQGWNPSKKNVIVIHGFNGTENKTPMTIIRDAYLKRGDYNVFMVDWSGLTYFPCYLSSLSNTRLVAQCAAQFYSHLTYNGASSYLIHCVGHSLGAHICGMMSNHLHRKINKIIGLDPARPLVDRYGTEMFKLTKDDANFVQVIHTNAGFLGETAQIGHIDFCVNGGSMQPSCSRQPQPLRQSRCSHFMSACFFAATIPEHGRRHRGLPCTEECKLLPGFRNVKGVSMGEHTPEDARGVFCLKMLDSKPCPFD